MCCHRHGLNSSDVRHHHNVRHQNLSVHTDLISISDFFLLLITGVIFFKQPEEIHERFYGLKKRLFFILISQLKNNPDPATSLRLGTCEEKTARCRHVSKYLTECCDSVKLKNHTECFLPAQNNHIFKSILSQAIRRTSLLPLLLSTSPFVSNYICLLLLLRLMNSKQSEDEGGRKKSRASLIAHPLSLSITTPPFPFIISIVNLHEKN